MTTMSSQLAQARAAHHEALHAYQNAVAAAVTDLVHFRYPHATSVRLAHVTDFVHGARYIRPVGVFDSNGERIATVWDNNGQADDSLDLLIAELDTDDRNPLLEWDDDEFMSLRLREVSPEMAADHPRALNVDDVRDGDLFSADNGNTWHVCAVNMAYSGSVAVYVDSSRDANAATVRIPVTPGQDVLFRPSISVSPSPETTVR